MPSKQIVAQDAHARREEFLKLHHQASLLQMKFLYDMWNNRDYEILGFENFKEYAECPEDSGGLGVSRSWAVQLARVYDKYVVELGVEPEDIYGTSPRKLYNCIKNVDKGNVDDIIGKAKSLSLRDFDLERKNIDPDTCDHDWTILKKCKKCSIWAQVEEK